MDRAHAVGVQCANVSVFCANCSRSTLFFRVVRLRDSPQVGVVSTCAPYSTTSFAQAMRVSLA